MRKASLTEITDWHPSPLLNGIYVFVKGGGGGCKRLAGAWQSAFSLSAVYHAFSVQGDMVVSAMQGCTEVRG